MALDIGMATGLAYKHDFQKDIRNRSMIQQLKRQKKIDNQTESRLWAKELETIAVQNPYDAKGLETYLDGHFKKAGKWLQEHPNFRENPSEFLTWTSKFVKPIKDNEFVRRDLSFQEQKKLYSQYVAKYGKDHYKTEQMSKQMESYRTMGNIDGDPAGGVKEFMFSAPYDGFDPLETISSYFGKLQPSGDAKPELKGGMWFYNASYDEKKAVASQMVADPNLRGMWDEWWTNMDDSQRRGDNVLDHIIEVGSPFVTPKTRTPQRPYASWFGVPNKEEGVQRLPAFFTDTKRTGSSTGNVTVVNENGMKQWLTEIEVPVTIEEAIKMEPIVQKQWNEAGLLNPGQKEEYLIDRSTWGGNLDIFSGTDEPDDFEIGSGYTDIFSKRLDIENQEKLSPEGQVTMKMWIPFNPEDTYFQRSYEADVTGKPSTGHPSGMEIPEGFIPSTGNPNQAYTMQDGNWHVIEFRNGKWYNVNQ